MKPVLSTNINVFACTGNGENMINEPITNSLRPAQLFGKRLRMSNENMNVIMAIAQLRQEKRNQMIEDEIETSKCKTRYYK